MVHAASSPSIAQSINVVCALAATGGRKAVSAVPGDAAPYQYAGSMPLMYRHGITVQTDTVQKLSEAGLIVQESCVSTVRRTSMTNTSRRHPSCNSVDADVIIDTRKSSG